MVNSRMNFSLSNSKESELLELVEKIDSCGWVEDKTINKVWKRIRGCFCFIFWFVLVSISWICLIRMFDFGLNIRDKRIGCFGLKSKFETKWCESSGLQIKFRIWYFWIRFGFWKVRIYFKNRNIFCSAIKEDELFH